MPIGAGEVGWRAHLRALHAAGYQGMLSMETHWRLVNLDESILHLPGNGRQLIAWIRFFLEPDPRITR